ncbi:MAG: SDR family oxidoreductase [Bowdeniella nasicola]|nr:SDR family oxidoreductase [Bowdeniella nasicola]
MDLQISGRSALVCASTSGLGFAIADALAADGVRVAVNGRTPRRCDEAAARIRERGGDAVAIAVDLTREKGPAELVERARAALGDLDILVLNGGGPPPSTAGAVDQAAITSAIDTLLRPHVALVRELMPAMRARGWGRVLAVGSSGIETPLPDLALSNLGRAALAGYLKTLAREVAADGVTVNLLLPGRINTERLTELDSAAARERGTSAEEVAASVIANIPAGRYGDPAEFGAAGAFLCSQRASFITGTALRVDGGEVASL